LGTGADEFESVGEKGDDWAWVDGLDGVGIDDEDGLGASYGECVGAFTAIWRA